MMDPTQLIAPPSSLGSPAPYWFLVLFKVIGFTLHIVPMHLWYAGVIVAFLLRWRGRADARTCSDRLMRQMPIIVAYGVNLGIVPLLFTQVAYYRVFYPATILMAWVWLSIFVLLTLAYYGIYIYASGLRDAGIPPLKRAAGWVSALVFMAIGFVFANAFSLMTNLRDWPYLWLTTSVGGAVTGTALNTADPTLWPRWLMMFGLALTTTATYTAVDAGLFAGGEGDAYRRWAGRFALRLYSLGIAWLAVTGTWYVFGTWSVAVRDRMLSGALFPLVLLTAFGPGLPWLLLMAQVRAGGPTRGSAVATGLAQLGVLALNAVSRQLVQNLELRPFLDPTAERVTLEWSPLVLFLLLFLAGLGVILWMVTRVVAANRSSRKGNVAAGPA
jgi:hypothetical protein